MSTNDFDSEELQNKVCRKRHEQRKFKSRRNDLSNSEHLKSNSQKIIAENLKVVFLEKLRIKLKRIQERKLVDSSGIGSKVYSENLIEVT